jgi:ribonuclease BN (tRNA processing enzyme)
VSPTLTVLGAGSIVPRAGFGCAGYALRPSPGAEVTLLDCGPGSVRMLGAVGIELAELRRVVISHFHLDHCLDLFALFFARRNPMLQPLPALEVVGPVGLRKLIGAAERAFGRGIEDPLASIYEVPLDERGQGSLVCGELTLSCVATGHTSEALAWRVDLPGGASLAYTGDTPESAEVARHAAGVDLFVSECSHREEHALPSHLTPARAGRMAAAAGCRKLLLSHFYPDVEPQDAAQEAARFYRGPIETARDGSVHAWAGAGHGSRQRM